MFPELVVFIAADGHLCACARIVKILPVRRHSGVFSALPRVRHLFCHIFLRGIKEYAKFNTIPNSVDTHGVYWLFWSDEDILKIKVRTKREKRPKTSSLRFDLLTIKMCTWDYNPWRLVIRYGCLTSMNHEVVGGDDREISGGERG